MARCEHRLCMNGMVPGVTYDERAGREVVTVAPCPECGGAYSEVSCCDGPSGAGLEPPTDPNATQSRRRS
jgi:hypothetical protein